MALLEENRQLQKQQADLYLFHNETYDVNCDKCVKNLKKTADLKATWQKMTGRFKLKTKYQEMEEKVKLQQQEIRKSERELETRRQQEDELEAEYEKKIAELNKKLET